MTSRMTSSSSLQSVMKDLYPGAGTRIKQYVVDLRNERAWAVATCPHVDVPEHRDNTDAHCRNVGSPIWQDLDHDCCYFCGDLQASTRDRADIAAWRDEASKRPRPCGDRSQLSDEVQSDYALLEHPFWKGRRGLYSEAALEIAAEGKPFIPTRAGLLDTVVEMVETGRMSKDDARDMLDPKPGVGRGDE